MSKIFIISGPSGAGEDSVIEGLKKELYFEKIITTTTRAIRPGETNAKNYYFINKKEFEQAIKNKEFFEWVEEDNGNLYGCTYKEIERIKKLKGPIIWKIEYQGVINAKKLIPEVISILIYVPLNTIRARLEKRGNHSEKFIKDRLEYAKGWFDNETIFDYKVENKDGKLEETIKKVKNIISENNTSC